jgi:hypothetical protein
MYGPIDFIIVRFEGNKFNGSILNALNDALEKKIINMISLTVIRKDQNGVVNVVDFEDSGDEYIIAFAKKYPGNPKLIVQEDIDEMATLLENNSSAGLLVVEHLWAVPLKRAIQDADGVLVADGRIHPEAANALEFSKAGG